MSNARNESDPFRIEAAAAISKNVNGHRISFSFTILLLLLLPFFFLLLSSDSFLFHGEERIPFRTGGRPTRNQQVGKPGPGRCGSRNA